MWLQLVFGHDFACLSGDEAKVIACVGEVEDMIRAECDVVYLHQPL